MKRLYLLILVSTLVKPAWAQQTQSIYYISATNADGKSNVTVGPYAGTGGGLQPVTIGAFAGQNNTATDNVFVGYGAGTQTSSEAYNAFLGRGHYRTKIRSVCFRLLYFGRRCCNTPKTTTSTLTPQSLSL